MSAMLNCQGETRLSPGYDFIIFEATIFLYSVLLEEDYWEQETSSPMHVRSRVSSYSADKVFFHQRVIVHFYCKKLWHISKYQFIDI